MRVNRPGFVAPQAAGGSHRAARCRCRPVTASTPPGTALAPEGPRRRRAQGNHAVLDGFQRGLKRRRDAIVARLGFWVDQGRADHSVPRKMIWKP